jgi:hypothetical protein
MLTSALVAYWMYHRGRIAELLAGLGGKAVDSGL